MLHKFLIFVMYQPRSLGIEFLLVSAVVCSSFEHAKVICRLCEVSFNMKQNIIPSFIHWEDFFVIIMCANLVSR